MLQHACQEPVARNRRRRPFPLESEVPGFAEHLKTLNLNVANEWALHVALVAEFRQPTTMGAFAQTANEWGALLIYIPPALTPFFITISTSIPHRLPLTKRPQ